MLLQLHDDPVWSFIFEHDTAVQYRNIIVTLFPHEVQQHCYWGALWEASTSLTSSSRATANGRKLQAALGRYKWNMQNTQMKAALWGLNEADCMMKRGHFIE